MNENYISTVEAAQLLGISRVAVFRKIKKGEIKAIKIGRNYVIDRRSLGGIYQDLTKEQERKVARGVEKVVKDFGEALRRLGSE
jgi:excisionase family DNA binding protein